MSSEPGNLGFTFEPEKCTECQRCMIECSLVKTGHVALASARLRIRISWPKVPELEICRFDDCGDKPCIDACPVDAITILDGIVMIDAEVCTGCEACVDVCPYHAIIVSRDLAAEKCDFCGGDPACVKECATEALTRKGS